ncbi:MAG TPA: exodeoxyribonuclease VII large subunit [Clostridia bacterium]|nr:exodeoxyribonuclease VII large subunit [Clostridia bacterium]
MSERGRAPEPPDWALPGWDHVADDAPHERASPRRLNLRPAGESAARPGTVPASPGAFGVRILNVSEVTRAIRGAVRAEPRLGDLWVEGEVGRVTISSAGHAYFALKDERSQLQCVWFRDDRVRSAFEPQAGLRVVAHGRIDLFEPQGALQLYVESIQPAGFGDLALRFEALKARLAAEGLFDAARKRPLPPRPRTIAVITSPSGAVWRDVCNVLARRWPLARVILVAARVQGEGAPASMVTAFRRLERWIATADAEGRPDDAPSVTILARGGGSLEDLWAFNDERVVRAVVGHSVPVVCGVGHEVDVTLADFAADVRAPTPSAAAEIVVPDRGEVALKLRTTARRLVGGAGVRLAAATRDVAAERRALDRLSPIAQLATARERTGLLVDRATRALTTRLAAHRRAEERAVARLGPLLPARLGRERARLPAVERLDAAARRRAAAARAALDAATAALEVLDPQRTLDRGYAIVRRAADGTILRDPAEAPGGTRLAVRVARGELPATVDRA